MITRVDLEPPSSSSISEQERSRRARDQIRRENITSEMFSGAAETPVFEQSDCTRNPLRDGGGRVMTDARKGRLLDGITLYYASAPRKCVRLSRVLAAVRCSLRGTTGEAEAMAAMYATGIQ